MYKGIVLKITSQYALVLGQDNGYYKLLVREGMAAGQKIYFFDEDIIGTSFGQRLSGQGGRNLWQKSISLSVIAVCLVLFFLFGDLIGVSSGKNALYAIVSVDINPSVEMQLNKEKYVIAVEPLNNEGYEVAGQYLVGLKIEDAVIVVVKNAAKKNYLNVQDTVLLAASVQSVNDEWREGLTSEIMEDLNSAQLPEDYSYILVASKAESYVQARQNKLSLGKYEMMTLLNKRPGSEKIDSQKIKEMNVKEILAEEKVVSALQEENRKSLVWIKGKDKNDDLKQDSIAQEDKKNNQDKKNSQEEEPQNTTNGNNNNDKDKGSVPANSGDRGMNDAKNGKKDTMKSPDPPQGNDTGSKDQLKSNQEEQVLNKDIESGAANQTPDGNKKGEAVVNNKGDSDNPGNNSENGKAGNENNQGKSDDQANNENNNNNGSNGNNSNDSNHTNNSNNNNGQTGAGSKNSKE